MEEISVWLRLFFLCVFIGLPNSYGTKHTDAACETDAECYSNVCFGGSCSKDSTVPRKVGDGGRCRKDFDCYSNFCYNYNCLNIGNTSSSGTNPTSPKGVFLDNAKNSTDFYQCVYGNGAISYWMLPWLTYFGITPRTPDPRLNDSCQIDNDCLTNWDSSPTHKLCKDGRCGCKLGYVALERSSSVWNCVREPTLNEACRKPSLSTCRKPLICAPIGGHKKLTTSTSSRTGPLKESDSDNRCQCLAPYVLRGKDCYLDCNEDEVYEDYQCRKRCSNDEILVQGNCTKMVPLGQPCQDTRQCSTLFAHCSGGICQCFGGFLSNIKDNKCEPQTYICPFGNALMDKSGRNVFKCRQSKDLNLKAYNKTTNNDLKIKEATNYPENKSLLCPDGYYCSISHFGQIYFTCELPTGHCCPNLKLSCPVGEPHPTAKCPEIYGISTNSITNSTTNDECPMATHYCANYTLAGDATVYVCCPQACSEGQTFINEKCYPIRKYGDQCEMTQQCGENYPFEGMVCKNGKCVCAEGYLPRNTTDSLNSSMIQICKRRCGKHEYESSTDPGGCAVMITVGDSCDVNGDCAPDGICSPKTKKCVCKCGYWPVSGLCARFKPSCPVQNGRGEITWKDIDGDSNGTDITFCQIPNAESPGEAADICPNGQYCAAYLYSVGVCCPRPKKAICRNGSEGTGKCDPSIPNACGADNVCMQYFVPAAQTSPSDGHVCCHKVSLDGDDDDDDE